MKLIHISDLHLGKRLNEFSLIEDQRYILSEILGVITDEKPDTVAIAGDIYDKSIPSTEAVELFDDFMYRLSRKNIRIFVVSGNHDSPERLAFGNRLMNKSGVHMSPVYNGKVEPVTLKDDYGDVNVYMLPFVKPSNVKRFFPDEEINNYTDAIDVAIRQMNIDRTKRNVLIAHQFVTGAKRSESEDISVGGLDNVDARVFDGFDYVCLGHIHGSQKVSSDRIYYSGTPLKYSFSEAKDVKSVAVVEIKEKGDLSIRAVRLTPMRDMVELRGKYSDLLQKKFYENTSYQSDYVKITLTDEEDILNALENLRVVYRNIMELRYDNKRTQSMATVNGAAEVEKKSPFELFAELYELQNGSAMTEEQSEFVREKIKEIWGE